MSEDDVVDILCLECEYYEELITSKSGRSNGECRRHPPKTFSSETRLEHLWPKVDGYNWCGEFKERI